MAATLRPFVYLASGIAALFGRTMEQETLAQISAALNAGSTNYFVFLRLYEVQPVHPVDSDALVQMALGTGGELGGIEQIQPELVWPTVKDALLYAGDAGAGPSDLVLKSGKFRSLIDLLGEQIHAMVKGSTMIESFWLRSGHPAYPVFCDFALIFRHEEGAAIFIGASSD